jgi:hypothetical protein
VDLGRLAPWRLQLGLTYSWCNFAIAKVPPWWAELNGKTSSLSRVIVDSLHVLTAELDTIQLPSHFLMQLIIIMIIWYVYSS